VRVWVLDTNMWCGWDQSCRWSCSDAESPKSEKYQHRRVWCWWCGAGDYPAYEKRTAYPAFAGPGPQPHEMYDQGGGVPGLRYRRGPGSQEADLLEAAGSGVCATGAGAGVGGGVGAGPAFINRRPSEPTHLSRHKSQGSYGNISESTGAYPSSLSPPPPAPPGKLYAAHYQRGYNPDFAPQQQPRASGGFSGGHSQEADPFQAAQHQMLSPPLQNPHSHPHDPYKVYADDAMSPADYCLVQFRDLGLVRMACGETQGEWCRV